MSVDGRGAARGDLVLAGRYRLAQPVARHRTTTLWRGVDEVLARPVAVRTLDRAASLPGGADSFLAAAVTAGRLAHPRIASVYDAATEGGLTYVVTEWVEGESLAATVRRGPLPPRRATTVVAQVAEAVAHAHARGVAHLDLDARNVLLGVDGAVKVTDFRLGALLRAVDHDPDQRGRVRADDPDEPSVDVDAMGALLYLCLTARSVDGADEGVPRAPSRDGVVLSPRQVRAGVPRELDLVVAQVLQPQRARGRAPITSAEGLLRALATLPGDRPDDARPAPVDVGRDRRSGARSRWLTVGVPAGLVGAIGAGALALGYSVGELPRAPGAVEPLDMPASAVPAAPDAESTAAARIVAVSAFDPPPGDRQERNRTVPLATDGDASTAWETVRYRTADFGGLKDGVGLLFDLGSPVQVRSVQIAFATRGVAVELRAATGRSDDPDAYRVVAADDDADERTTLRPDGAPTARYWLVWITRLAEADDDEGRFHAGIAEVAFGR